MRRFLLVLAFILFFFFTSFHATYAIEDPFSMPNNKIGIHILFPTELEDAAKLVNTNGGDWGYVTIPIQSGDRDIDKWQGFMDNARRLHLIPIIRLATEGDYFNTKVWRKPNETDIIDFANFLNSLTWPTKNRYVIVFNEVNRADEWGGEVNPEEYTNLLSYAVTVFKSKSQDFFIISAGLDNAAPNEGLAYMNQYDFMKKMQDSVPGIFNQIDGLSSHSYPNPGFSQPPSVNTTKSIMSFKYERDLATLYSNKTLPVFITETGWTNESVSDATRSMYYTQALQGPWSDPGIVAITPFLLKAGGGPFSVFSFLNGDGNPTQQYATFLQLPKVKGAPTLTQITNIVKKQKKVLGAQTIRDFSYITKEQKKVHLSLALQSAFKWIMKI